MGQLASEKTIQDLLNCYSSLGSKKTKIGQSFAFYHCEYWRNFVMSPVFITSTKGWETDLPKVEKAFKTPVPKSPYNAGLPYFNLLTKGKASVDKKLIKKLEAEGWSASDYESSLNVWRRPIPLSIPKDILIKSGNYFDPEIYSEFLKTMKDNFSSSDLFMKTLNKMLKGVQENLITVLLCHKGKTIGAVVVAVKNEGAYLFCGSINKSHRSKDLWSVLHSATQAISGARGAKIWVFTTATKQLLWRGDETYRVNIFTKKFN